MVWLVVSLRWWNPPAKTTDSGAPVRDPKCSSGFVWSKEDEGRLRSGSPRVQLARGVSRVLGVDQGIGLIRLGLGRVYGAL